MSSSFASTFVTTPTLLALLSVMALLVSGASLIASGVRVGREAVARRVDLIIPAGRAEITAKKTASALENDFLRLRLSGQPEREQREMFRRLSELGIPIQYAATLFLAAKILSAAVFGVLMLLLARYISILASSRLATLSALAGAAVLGWLLPTALIRMSARQKAKAAAAGLPEALDLLVVCVDAGLSLEDGFARITNELKRSQPALANELALTSADLQILQNREEALMNMAERVNLPDVRSFVTTLAQTLRYGTPLAKALRVISAEMRNDSLTQLEERANALPALLTVPMMVFIMPTIFLIILGPAIVKVLDIMAR